MRLFVKEASTPMDPSDGRKLPRPAIDVALSAGPKKKRGGSQLGEQWQLEALVVAGDFAFYVILGVQTGFFSAVLMVCMQLYQSTYKSICHCRSNWCISEGEFRGSIINTVTKSTAFLVSPMS